MLNGVGLGAWGLGPILREIPAPTPHVPGPEIVEFEYDVAPVANVRERVEGDVGIVEMVGRLTINDQPGLLKEAVASIVRQGAKNVLVDLSGVPYIDSTRLGELIAAHVTVSRQGGRLKLVRTPDRVVELLIIAGLGDVFERFDAMDEAKDSFK